MSRKLTNEQIQIVSLWMGCTDSSTDMTLMQGFI